MGKGVQKQLYCRNRFDLKGKAVSGREGACCDGIYCEIHISTI
jgi:hypothetical protein